MTTYRITVEVRQVGAIGVFEDKQFQVTTQDGLVEAIKLALASARKQGFEIRFAHSIQEWLPDKQEWLEVTNGDS